MNYVCKTWYLLHILPSVHNDAKLKCFQCQARMMQLLNEPNFSSNIFFAQWNISALFSCNTIQKIYHFQKFARNEVVKVNLMKNELFHLGGLPTTRFGLCTDCHSNAHVQWKPDRPERTFVWCAMFRKWKILKERFNHFTNSKFRKDFRCFNYLFL